MKLTVADRAIIATNFLKRFGTIASVKATKSIKTKLVFSADEEALIKVETDGTGVTTCFFEPAAHTTEKEVKFTDEELAHILTTIEELDQNGMIEESIMDTIDKLMSEKEKIKAGN
jgi:hypothetical protein